MFCVQLYGKWVRWGCYNLYFEALQGLLFWKAPIFFISVLRKCHAAIPEHNQVDPLGGLNLKRMKSLLSPCDYTRVVPISGIFDSVAKILQNWDKGSRHWRPSKMLYGICTKGLGPNTVNTWWFMYIWCAPTKQGASRTGLFWDIRTWKLA